MANEFSVGIEHDGGVPIVRVSGDVDLANAPSLIEALMDLSEAGAGEVRMDLGEVTFLDSAGIGALVRGMRAGLALEITRSSKPVDRALELAGMADLLERSD